MSAELVELNSLLAEFPPDMIQRVVNYARMLRLSRAGNIDMSEPTEEELREESNHVLRRFDEEHPGEEWSRLRPANPGGYK